MKKLNTLFVILIFTLVACDKTIVRPSDIVYGIEDTIIFHADSIGCDNKHVYTMYIDGSNIKRVIDYGQLPIWFENKSKILYMDKRSYQIKLNSLQDTSFPDSFSYNENLDFMRYSRPLNCLLFQYKEDGRYRLAKIDLVTFELEDISEPPYDEIYPQTSLVDDWIYFSTRVNDTWDIYKMKIDRSLYQPVLQNPDYHYNTFSVSADGKHIVTPKYNDDESYIVIYDIDQQEESIIYQSHYGNAIYATFSYNKKYVIFLIGIPYDFITPREIYRINSDGSHLVQLTYFNNLIGRPIAW